MHVIRTLHGRVVVFCSFAADLPVSGTNNSFRTFLKNVYHTRDGWKTLRHEYAGARCLPSACAADDLTVSHSQKIMIQFFRGSGMFAST